MSTKPLTIPPDVASAAKSMRDNDYRGPLSYAKKVFDWVANQGGLDNIASETSIQPKSREWRELDQDQIAAALFTARSECFPDGHGVPVKSLEETAYRAISNALRIKNGF